MLNNIRFRREGDVHANFSIHPDAARRTIQITFRGFWSTGVVDIYCAERGKMLQKLAAAECPFSSCIMLVDARDLKAQPLDSIELFARRVGGSADQPKLSALLVASALFTLQGQRMAIPHQRLFNDRSEALAWLGWPT